MAKKEFEVHVEVNWNASNIKIIRVRTNNSRNAEKLAIAKLSKKYDVNMMTIKTINVIE